MKHDFPKKKRFMYSLQIFFFRPIDEEAIIVKEENDHAQVSHFLFLSFIWKMDKIFKCEFYEFHLKMINPHIFSC